MAAEDLIEEHVKAFNAHDANAWASHYAENATLYDPQYPEPARGRAAVLKDIEDFFTAFPDIQFNATNVVAHGDRAAIEGVGSGTHGGPMEGPGGTIPATNKRAEMPFASFIRLNSQGRYYDLAGMMQQLDLM